MPGTSLKSAPFRGPLFVVGMPRSGTKLLRDLLNRHPRIGIPRVETEFLPYWIESWAKFGDLSDRDRFAAFYKQLQGTPYFRYQSADSNPIDETHWFESCESFSPEAVFEALVRHDGGADADSDGVWGDKSPSYIRHIEGLADRFPSARFVHIVRDARDYCLSIRNAWNKNMLRAAQRWADDVQSALDAAEAMGDRVLLTRYEDLLDNAEVELTRICEHLGLPFLPEMTQLAQTAENLGDTAGATEIVASNQAKYRDALSPKQIFGIERISCEGLRRLDYPVAYSDEAQHLTTGQMQFYRFTDGFNLLWSDLKRGDLWSRIGLRWRHSRGAR